MSTLDFSLALAEGEIRKHFPRRIAWNSQGVCNHWLWKAGRISYDSFFFLRQHTAVGSQGGTVCILVSPVRSGVSRTRARSQLPRFVEEADFIIFVNFSDVF